jgi:hypothetical protein
MRVCPVVLRTKELQAAENQLEQFTIITRVLRDELGLTLSCRKLATVFYWRHSQIALMLKGKYPTISRDLPARKVSD